MTQLINQDQIKEHIIHRYENLLLDEVSIDKTKETITGTFKLCITNHDSLSRQIFSKSKEKNKKILTPQLCMESLALASIVCSGKLKKNQMAIFAGITNFKKENDLPFGEPLIGYVEKQGDKNGFLKFKGSLSNTKGHSLASGEMMAYFSDTTISNDESTSKKLDPINIPKNKTPII